MDDGGGDVGVKVVGGELWDKKELVWGLGKEGKGGEWMDSEKVVGR